MLKTRQDLVRTITEEMAGIEQLLDEAQARTARLMATAVEGRRAAHLPLHAGETALEHLASSQAALLATRKSVHAAHYDFREVRDLMRIAPVSYGDFGDTPREYAPTEGAAARPSLAVVNAA